MWEVEKGTDHKESYINYGFLRDWRENRRISKWDKLAIWRKLCIAE
jgi:hypothetical protein